MNYGASVIYNHKNTTDKHTASWWLNAFGSLRAFCKVWRAVMRLLLNSSLKTRRKCLPTYIINSESCDSLCHWFESNYLLACLLVGVVLVFAAVSVAEDMAMSCFAEASVDCECVAPCWEVRSAVSDWLASCWGLAPVDCDWVVVCWAARSETSGWTFESVALDCCTAMLVDDNWTEFCSRETAVLSEVCTWKTHLNSVDWTTPSGWAVAVTDDWLTQCCMSASAAGDWVTCCWVAASVACDWLVLCCAAVWLAGGWAVLCWGVWASAVWEVGCRMQEDTWDGCAEESGSFSVASWYSLASLSSSELSELLSSEDVDSYLQSTIVMFYTRLQQNTYIKPSDLMKWILNG